MLSSFYFPSPPISSPSSSSSYPSHPSPSSSTFVPPALTFPMYRPFPQPVRSFQVPFSSYLAPKLERTQRHGTMDIIRTIPSSSSSSNPSSWSPSSSSPSSILAPSLNPDSYPKLVMLTSINGQPIQFQAQSITMEEEIKTSIVTSTIVLYEHGQSLNYSQLKAKYLAMKQSITDNEHSRLSSSPPPPPPPHSLDSNKILDEIWELRRYVERFKHIQMDVQYDILHNIKTIIPNRAEARRKEQNKKRYREEEEEQKEEEKLEVIQMELQLKNANKRDKKEEADNAKRIELEIKKAAKNQQQKIIRRRLLQNLRRERIRESKRSKAKPEISISKKKSSCVRCGRSDPPGGLHILGSTQTSICRIKKNCPKLLQSLKEMHQAAVRSRQNDANAMKDDNDEEKEKEEMTMV